MGGTHKSRSILLRGVIDNLEIRDSELLQYACLHASKGHGWLSGVRQESDTPSEPLSALIHRSNFPFAWVGA